MAAMTSTTAIPRSVSRTELGLGLGARVGVTSTQPRRTGPGEPRSSVGGATANRGRAAGPTEPPAVPDGARVLGRPTPACVEGMSRSNAIITMLLLVWNRLSGTACLERLVLERLVSE